MEGIHFFLFICFTRSTDSLSRGSCVFSFSWSPRVFYFPNFLSENECDFFISRALSAPEFDPREEFNSVYMSEEERTQHPIVLDVERRMAALTGSPVHTDEETRECLF